VVVLVRAVCSGSMIVTAVYSEMESARLLRLLSSRTYASTSYIEAWCASLQYVKFLITESDRLTSISKKDAAATVLARVKDTRMVRLQRKLLHIENAGVYDNQDHSNYFLCYSCCVAV
jgi:hypothetical protein